MESFLETVYGDRHFATGAQRQQFTGAVTAWHEAVISVERGASAFLPDLSAAARLGVTESALKAVVYRLRCRYGELFREEIAHTVSRPEEVEDEIRHLLAVLREE